MYFKYNLLDDNVYEPHSQNADDSFMGHEPPSAINAYNPAEGIYPHQ